MRTASKWVLVGVVSLAVAGTVAAQPPGGGRGGRGGFGGGMFGGGPMLLANEGVQKELKLTDDQKTKVKEFTDAQMAKMREAFTGGQPDREKMQEMRKEMQEKGDKFVKDTLNADQQKRFKQIELQRDGLRAFQNADVQTALKLTDDQKEKLKGLGEEYMKDMQDLRGAGGRGGANAETMNKMRALNKEYMTKATGLLTADQKKEWKEMTGEPFEVQMTGGRRGAGGDNNAAGGRRRGGNNGTPPAGGGSNPPPA